MNAIAAINSSASNPDSCASPCNPYVGWNITFPASAYNVQQQGRPRKPHPSHCHRQQWHAGHQSSCFYHQKEINNPPSTINSSFSCNRQSQILSGNSTTYTKWEKSQGASREQSYQCACWMPHNKLLWSFTPNVALKARYYVVSYMSMRTNWSTKSTDVSNRLRWN